MQPNKSTSELLDRYLSGKCTEEERTLVEQYYLEQYNAADIHDAGDDNIKAEMWNKLQIATGHHHSRQRRLWPKIAIAASVVLCFTLSYLSYYYFSKSSGSSTESKLYSVGLGSRRKITLIDGTTVILNAGSKLILDRDFNQKQRLVSLEGEGYFNVVHKNDCPFVVMTPDLEINDLGTVFNVKAYQGDRRSEATLIEGAIEVQLKGQREKILLKPSQKFLLDKEYLNSAAVTREKIERNGAYKLISTTENSVTGKTYEEDWINNRLSFNDKLLTDIVPEIERWYNVKIQINNKLLRTYRFTSTFERETIDQVMQTLALTANFEFRREGSEITIL